MATEKGLHLWETPEGGPLEFSDETEELNPWAEEGIAEFETLLRRHAKFLMYLEAQEITSE